MGNLISTVPSKRGSVPIVMLNYLCATPTPQIREHIADGLEISLERQVSLIAHKVSLEMRYFVTLY